MPLWLYGQMGTNVARDKTRAALEGDVGPRPLEDHKEPVAEADEETRRALVRREVKLR